MKQRAPVVKKNIHYKNKSCKSQFLREAKKYSDIALLIHVYIVHLITTSGQNNEYLPIMLLIRQAKLFIMHPLNS